MYRITLNCQESCTQVKVEAATVRKAINKVGAPARAAFCRRKVYHMVNALKVMAFDHFHASPKVKAFGLPMVTLTDPSHGFAVTIERPGYRGMPGVNRVS